MSKKNGGRPRNEQVGTKSELDGRLAYGTWGYKESDGDKKSETDCATERNRLYEDAAPTRSGTEMKGAMAGESESANVVALLSMTMRFLDMGFAFRSNPDIWQVIKAKKCKKTSI